MSLTVCRCGHLQRSHREFFTDEERKTLALPPGAGCNVGNCSCVAFVELAPTPPGDDRLCLANDQQREVIQRLGQAIGFTLTANWDALPTGKTRGLQMSQMFISALVYALANLLACGLEEATETERAESIALVDALLRDQFPHALARQQLETKTEAAATEIQSGQADALLENKTPARVTVPQPKRVM